MMRLTLRTLLAYLDDILSPADTKVIGQKIQESPMAQLLVSRIREVMRRRRLASPDVSGPEMGIDPNIVSQYLDNTLPPDRYADVERVLLASDELLAEAAASHQVLALILGEAAEVPQSSRERWYALGPVDASSQLSVPEPKPVSHKTPHSISIPNVAATAAPVPVASADEDRITTLPDYLKPAPLSQRLVPSAIMILLVLLCGALLGPGLMNALNQANHEIRRSADRQKVGEITETPDETVATNAGDHEALSLNSVVPTRPAETTATISGTIPPGIDPMPPEDVVDANPKAGTGDAVEPPASALTTAEPPAPAADQVKPAAPVIAESPIAYTSTDGVLIRYDGAERHWLRVAHRSDVPAGAIIANLEPYDGTLDFSAAGIRATLVGETVVKLLSAKETGISGMGIGRGRILLQPLRNDDVPVSIGIAIGEDIWKLELPTRDSFCGLEVIVRESTQFQKLNDYHWYQAMLYVVSGSVKWTNRAGQTQEITDHMALNIIPDRAATVRSNPISFPTAPDWCDAARRRSMPLRKLQGLFEKSFVEKEPVEELMLNLVKSTRNPKLAELATRCLAATDSDMALVETLAECTHEEARFAARDGLRQWLPISPENGPRLKAELDSHYQPADAEAIYRMLWGFSREDVRDSKATSWQFTNWMRNPHQEIRELADYWVERLTGRKTEYRASAGVTQRETQVRRLEEQIERDNGLIKVQ